MRIYKNIYKNIYRKNINFFAIFAVIGIMVLLGIPQVRYFVSSIIIALYESLKTPEIYVHILNSLKRIVVGYTTAIFIGVSMGFLIAQVKQISFLKNIVELVRPIPPIARIPIAILIFGLGDNSAYFIVFLGSFFPIFTNTYFGVKSLPEKYHNHALNFEIKKCSFFYHIVFKHALPYIFTGLKIGIGMGWMSLIAAELIGSQNGLGYYIQINRLLLNIENVIVGMLIIGCIGFLLNYLLISIEKKIIRRK